jgi:hypothetical protein
MMTHLVDRNVPIIYVAKFREYGIRVADGGSSYILLKYCPWCGKALPDSLRDEWFEEIERLGLGPEDTRLPLRYSTDEWWSD